MTRRATFAFPELQVLMQAAEKFDYLTPEEEKQLADKLQNGTPAQRLAARNRLVTSHLRLAYSISRKYFSNSRLPQDELAQQAALGLFAATNKFDARAKFATYATRWIFESVKLYAIRYHSIVAVPTSADRKRKRVLNAVKAADLENFSFADLSRELGMKPSEVAMFMTLGHEESLNAPMGEDGDSQRQDFLRDNSDVNPLADMETGQFHAVLRQALAELSPRERHVLTARNGVDSDDIQTLDVLAQEYGVSRERIRQIEVTAKRKMREGSYARQLAEFL